MINFYKKNSIFDLKFPKISALRAVRPSVARQKPPFLPSPNFFMPIFPSVGLRPTFTVRQQNFSCLAPPCPPFIRCMWFSAYMEYGGGRGGRYQFFWYVIPGAGRGAPFGPDRDQIFEVHHQNERFFSRCTIKTVIFLGAPLKMVKK